MIYIAPDITSTIEGIVTVISKRPRRAELLVSGNFNIDLAEPEGTSRDEDIAEALAAAGLEYMSAPFLPMRKSWSRDGRIWNMFCGLQEVPSRNDYLLETDLHLFQNVLLQDERQNIDHCLVLGCLRGAASTEHSR